MRNAQLKTAEDVRTFMLAGDATLTLVSLKTGARFTYRVRRLGSEDRSEDSAPQKDIWFVSLLSGADNEGDYAYLGQIWPPRGYSAFTRERLEYVHGKKSRVSQSAPSAQAFAWFARKVFIERILPDSLECWHEGKCGRCGRKLTVPGSIARGIGPDCAEVMGIVIEDEPAPRKPKFQPESSLKSNRAASMADFPFNDDIPFGLPQ
jgi:hypothetical protein